jgi:hypothetical protein
MEDSMTMEAQAIAEEERSRHLVGRRKVRPFTLLNMTLTRLSAVARNQVFRPIGADLKPLTEGEANPRKAPCLPAFCDAFVSYVLEEVEISCRSFRTDFAATFQTQR